MAEMKARAAIKKAAQNTQIAQHHEGNNIKSLVQRMSPQIAKALPKVREPERFTRIVLTALSSNPQLQECTQDSFLGAMMQAAQLGLEPNTPLGQAYLIPYRDNRKGVTECTFQLGYQGLLNLAYRTGEYKDIYAHTVYENDEFEYELGMEPKLTHKPKLSGRGKPVAYYAVFHLKNGGYGMTVMSYEDVEKHKKAYSKSGNYGPWANNFDSMAKKTCIKQLLKYAPKSIELATATAADEGIKNIKPEQITPDLDMGMVQNDDYIDITPGDDVPSNVDPETGEVMEPVHTGDPDLDEILNGEG